MAPSAGFGDHLGDTLRHAACVRLRTLAGADPQLRLRWPKRACAGFVAPVGHRADPVHEIESCAQDTREVGRDSCEMYGRLAAVNGGDDAVACAHARTFTRGEEDGNGRGTAYRWQFSVEKGRASELRRPDAGQAANARIGNRRAGDARRYPWCTAHAARTMKAVTATATPSAQSTVRVLVVGDHPALRAGLDGLLSNEPGVECVGALDGTDRLLAAVHDLRPDVVVLDYALGADDGLTTCFRLKQQPHPAVVVLYSAYVDGVFAVPAAIAQADATVSKSAPIDQLLSAVHGAAAGTQPRRRHDAELVQAASARLLTDDLPIAMMLLAATPVGDIADILETTPPTSATAPCASSAASRQATSLTG